MKQLILSLFFLAAAIAARAKDVDGYILTSNNDTVRCTIRVGDLDLFDKVTIIDSSGKKVKYRANDLGINGFGFLYRDQQYDYVLKADEKSNWSFMIRQASGPRLWLYYSWTFTYTGKGSYRTDSYMLEDSAKKVVTVSGGIFSGYKKHIRAFLSGDPALSDLFDKEVSGFSDIPRFVRAANARA